MKAALVAFLGVALPSAAAAYSTGNLLLEACKQQDNPYCLTYVMAFTDGYRQGHRSGVFSTLAHEPGLWKSIDDASGKAKQYAPFCPPAGVTYEQIKDVVVKWLTDHPEQRHNHASAVIVASIAEAFPCK